MTAFFLFSSAQSTAGTRYASDLPDARARLDHQMPLLVQRLRHRHRHLLLLRAILEILRLRQQPLRRKNLAHARDKFAASGGRFLKRDHGENAHVREMRRAPQAGDASAGSEDFCQKSPLLFNAAR